MNKLPILFLFCTSFVYAGDTNITSKVFEKRDKDGKIDFRMETIYRGKTKVMLITGRPNKEGVIAVTSRSYLVGGNLVMSEDDENRDGIFETIVIHRSGTNDLEIFTRQPDGSVTPADTKIVEATRKQSAVLDEFWNKAFQKEMSDQELADSLLETRQKIQALDKEKKDDKN